MSLPASARRLGDGVEVRPPRRTRLRAALLGSALVLGWVAWVALPTPPGWQGAADVAVNAALAVGAVLGALGSAWVWRSRWWLTRAGVAKDSPVGTALLTWPEVERMAVYALGALPSRGGWRPVERVLIATAADGRQVRILDWHDRADLLAILGAAVAADALPEPFATDLPREIARRGP